MFLRSHHQIIQECSQNTFKILFDKHRRRSQHFSEKRYPFDQIGERIRLQKFIQNLRMRNRLNRMILLITNKDAQDNVNLHNNLLYFLPSERAILFELFQQEVDGGIFVNGFSLADAIVFEMEGLKLHELFQDLYADFHAYGDIFWFAFLFEFVGCGG